MHQRRTRDAPSQPAAQPSPRGGLSLFRVTTSYACFAFEARDGIIERAAPIGGWMEGKRFSTVRAWADRKGWTIEAVRG